jgi:4-diphosphocytidyl-2-C-methyl-D-erythritol kinase
MVSFPNAKLNLGLHIVERRSDGYHNIETVFLPIEITDALEIVETDNKEKELDFNSSGLQIVGDISLNLCVRAYKLLKKDFSLPPVKMHLLKSIPMGAGLGGGSADGAFALKMLNEKFNLNIPTSKLLSYALQLGSDCPFFIINKPCFASSRGEDLNEIKLDLSTYKIIIINPGIHISTAWAFGNIEAKQPKKCIAEIIKQPIDSWKNELKNDFEDSVLNEHPSVKKIKDTLYNYGAIYASLTGTGSTVFGIFKNQIDEAVFDFPKGYLVKWLTVLKK